MTTSNYKPFEEERNAYRNYISLLVSLQSSMNIVCTLTWYQQLRNCNKKGEKWHKWLVTFSRQQPPFMRTYVQSWLKLTNSKFPVGSPPYAARFMRNWGQPEPCPSGYNQIHTNSEFLHISTITKAKSPRSCVLLTQNLDVTNYPQCISEGAVRRTDHDVLKKKHDKCRSLHPTYGHVWILQDRKSVAEGKVEPT